MATTGSSDRLPEHLARTSYIEEKDNVLAMKFWALQNSSTVSEFIRTAVVEHFKRVDPKGEIHKKSKELRKGKK